MSKKHHTTPARRDGKKIAKAIAAIVLLLAVSTASVFTTGAIITGTGNPAKWGNNQTEKPTPPADDTPPTDEEHTHTYDRTKWSFNDTHHYHKATCEHFLITDVAEHTYANGVCTVCGNKYSGTKADMLLTGGAENGISLMSNVIPKSEYIANGISTYADTAYTLIATVYDENHTTNGMPQAVDFSIEWEPECTENTMAGQNPISKYITLTRLSENSAKLVCLQEFDCPAVIKVTAKNSDKSASRHCEYLKRVNISSMWFGNNSKISINSLSNYYDDSFTFGLGTVTGNLIADTITYYFQDNFLNKLTETSYYKYFEQKCTEAGFELDLGYEVVKELNCNKDRLDAIQLNLEDFLLTNMDVATVTAISETVGLDYFKYAVIAAAKEVSQCVKYSIAFGYSYNGIVYSNGRSDSGPPQSFDVSALGELPPVGSVDIGGAGGGIIF